MRSVRGDFSLNIEKMSEVKSSPDSDMLCLDKASFMALSSSEIPKESFGIVPWMDATWVWL